MDEKIADKTIPIVIVEKHLCAKKQTGDFDIVQRHELFGPYYWELNDGRHSQKVRYCPYCGHELWLYT